MTELRQRMDEDMIVRGMADRTRETYLWAVTGLARFYHRSPDQIADAEVQAYLLHLIRDRQRSWSTCNIVVHGLRFFYHETLKRDRTTFCIPSPRQPGTLPALLSRAEVRHLIAHAANLKHRTMLMTTYAGGKHQPRPVGRPHGMPHMCRVISKLREVAAIDVNDEYNCAA